MTANLSEPKPESPVKPGNLRLRQPHLVKETPVLSPHELATLMLVGNGPQTQSDDCPNTLDAREIDPVDLDALVSQELVHLEPSRGGRPCLRITPRGDSMLKAVARRH